MSDKRFPGWFPPTPEQERAIELFLAGESLAIEAGAGTGKTSTLLHLAHATERKGQYIAFNKSIVKEAGSKFPRNVACNTAHSLAFRAVAAGTPFEARQRSGKRMRSHDIANLLKVDALNVTDSEGNRKHLSRSFLAGLVMRGVTRFCQTADEAPNRWHIPYVEGLDPVNDGRRRGVNNRAVGEHLESALKRAWADLTSFEGGLPFTLNTAMSVYLKLWQLGKPKVAADFILFDEAQDANPVMVSVVSAQTHAQLVWVGDSQQQIYEFTGAVNALQNVPADHRAFLTQSFRFGPAVADMANHVLAQIESAELRLVGWDEIPSKVTMVTDPAAVLCRTNAAAVETVLSAQADSVKVHLVGGGDDVASFARAARKLMNEERTEHPELACFESWGEVQEYVAQDEQGGDLRLLVSLVDRFGVEVILAALDNQVKEDEAELVVSTAHKAKGREWASVKLGPDFPEDDKLAGNDSELRLLYVAVTRAQRELDVTNVKFLQEGYSPVKTLRFELEPDELDEDDDPAPAVEVVETKTSEYVGEVGDWVERTLRCLTVAPVNSRFGDTFICGLVDEETGEVFKVFYDDGLTEGKLYDVSGRVKEHREFRGVKETSLNRIAVWEAEEKAPAPAPAPEPVAAPVAPPAPPAFEDDGEPF